MPAKAPRYNHSQAWLDAVHVAGECLRRKNGSRQQQQQQQGSNNNNNPNGNDAKIDLELMNQVDEAIAFLERLEEQLATIPQSSWKSPPREPPVSFSNHVNPTTTTTTTTGPSPPVGAGFAYPAHGPIPSQVRFPTPASLNHPPASTPPMMMMMQNPYLQSNPYASIAMSDDEQDDDDDDDDVEDAAEDDNDDDDDMDEAGDRPTLNINNQQQKGGTMSILRLVIRINSTSSDLWAFKGNMLGTDRQWALGTSALQCALDKMRHALSLADSQISRYYDQNVNSKNAKQRQKDLEDDADIVHVAIESLVVARDKYVRGAERRMRRLKEILAPQWQSRDRVKDQWGKDRWENNPNPKHTFALQREESEQELAQVEEALQILRQDQDQINIMANSAMLLKNKLLKANRHRYNGKRPDEGNAGQRLPGYPDPTEFGWTFTGSHPPSRVAFFERPCEDGSIVKLDFYYTTGTVKTSMDHPKQGKTQLFLGSEQITVELYVQILMDPRTHTNVRYSTTDRKPGGGQQQGRQSSSRRPRNNNNNHNSPNNGNRNSDNNNNNNDNRNNGHSNGRNNRGPGRGGPRRPKRRDS